MYDSLMILILSNFTILLTTTCRIIKIITENTTYVSCRKYEGAPHFKQKNATTIETKYNVLTIS